MIDWFSDLWDGMKDGLVSFFTFGWVSDLWGFISSSFEDIGEVSVTGIVFGLLGVGLIFVFRGSMLEPFLKFYSPAERLFWGGITYLGTGIAGYFMGKYFESNG